MRSPLSDYTARVRTSVTGLFQSRDFGQATWPRRRAIPARSIRSASRGSFVRSLGNMLRSVVSREGCRHDAGSVQFRRVHLIGVLSVAGDGPDPDITGTASLRDLVSLQSGRRSGQAQLVGATSILKVDPSTHMRCNTTAMRRAKATIARFRPRRLATRDAHVRSALPRPRFSMTVAA